MLVDFSVCNFGPFRDRVTLSMLASSSKEHPENAVEVGAIRGRLLTSAVIFGANASGKSTVFEAFRSLKGIVSSVGRNGRTSGAYKPFRLDRNKLNAPVELAVRFVEDGVLYSYHIAYTRDTVVSEGLSYYPNGRSRRVFERTAGPDGMTYKGGKADYARKTTAFSSYLAVAADYNDPLCLKVRSLIDGVIVVAADGTSGRPLRTASFSEDGYAELDHKDYTVDLLNAADLAIVDVRLKLEDQVDQFEDGDRMKTVAYSMPRFLLKHQHPKSDVDDESAYFPIGIESSGTRQLFGMSDGLIDALVNGKTLMIDEFGSYLHPSLTRWIIEQFCTDYNVNSAQLIVNTHDMTLMDTENLLRRDQIYFADKNREDGASELYSVLDFKGVSAKTDVPAEYFMGRYGAIPVPKGHRVIGCRESE